jgi:hypothetical protein
VGEGILFRHDAALGRGVEDMLPFAKAVYAPASMIELKVSVTASTGMQARIAKSAPGDRMGSLSWPDSRPEFNALTLT